MPMPGHAPALQDQVPGKLVLLLPAHHDEDLSGWSGGRGRNLIQQKTVGTEVKITRGYGGESQSLSNAKRLAEEDAKVASEILDEDLQP